MFLKTNPKHSNKLSSFLSHSQLLVHMEIQVLSKIQVSWCLSFFLSVISGGSSEFSGWRPALSTGHSRIRRAGSTLTFPIIFFQSSTVQGAEPHPILKHVRNSYASRPVSMAFLLLYMPLLMFFKAQFKHSFILQIYLTFYRFPGTVICTQKQKCAGHVRSPLSWSWYFNKWKQE